MFRIRSYLCVCIIFFECELIHLNNYIDTSRFSSFFFFKFSMGIALFNNVHANKYWRCHWHCKLIVSVVLYIDTHLFDYQKNAIITFFFFNLFRMRNELQWKKNIDIISHADFLDIEKNDNIYVYTYVFISFTKHFFV